MVMGVRVQVLGLYGVLRISGLSGLGSWLFVGTLGGLLIDDSLKSPSNCLKERKLFLNSS